MSAGIEPITATDNTAYDHETDILVVGFGAAGAAAAIEAAHSGADVIVLEALSGPGGSSAQSGGELYLGGGTRLQKACGVTDTVEAMYDYLVRALGPHADEAKLRLYCEGSVEHFEWFCDLGVPFEESLFDEPAWMPPTKDGLMWLGENAWPFSESSVVAPRGHRPARPWFAGSLLMEHLAAAVTEAGAQVHLDTRAVALALGDDGCVEGLRARNFGSTVAYRARRGVVLTTGGFVDNDEMLADHAPVLLGHGKVSDGGDDGSGIRLATAAGAATRRMASVQAALTFVPSLACQGIVVDARGQRFMNEDVYPGRLSHEALLHRPAPWWVLVDEQGLEASGPPYAQMPPQYAAETLDELEAELGMPEGALQATVAEYNKHAAQGQDPYHHRASRLLRPLSAPFAVFDPRAAGAAAGNPTGIAGFTLGGLHTTPHGEVRHVSGRLIPGLYAAGRAASGIHGEGYVSGTSLGDGTFFGRRAGRAAAQREPDAERA